MSRAASLACLFFLLAPVGCAKDADYLEVYRAQRENYKELADILATIKDEKSMADAKTALDERAKKFDEVAGKASALPKPPPASVLQRMEEDRYAMERTIKRLQTEIDRVRHEVKGGEAFWKQFESKSPGLSSAVKR